MRPSPMVPHVWRPWQTAGFCFNHRFFFCSQTSRGWCQVQHPAHILCTMPLFLSFVQASNDLQTTYLQLASPAILQLAAELTSQMQQSRVRDLLLGAAHSPNMAGLIGQLFEQHGHAQVCTQVIVILHAHIRSCFQCFQTEKPAVKHVSPCLA